MKILATLFLLFVMTNAYAEHQLCSHVKKHLTAMADKDMDTYAAMIHPGIADDYKRLLLKIFQLPEERHSYFTSLTKGMNAQQVADTPAFNLFKNGFLKAMMRKETQMPQMGAIKCFGAVIDENTAYVPVEMQVTLNPPLRSHSETVKSSVKDMYMLENTPLGWRVSFKKMATLIASKEKQIDQLLSESAQDSSGNSSRPGIAETTDLERLSDVVKYSTDTHSQLQALRRLQDLAYANNAAAQYVLSEVYSEMYSADLHIKDSEELSWFWLRQAAKNSHAEACVMLAFKILTDRIDLKDRKDWRRWLKMASDDGSAKATMMMADILRGRYRPLSEAFREPPELDAVQKQKLISLYEKAVSQGSIDARNALAKIWFFDSDDRKTRCKAYEILKPVEKPEGYLMALLYDQGECVPRDEELAFRLMEPLAPQKESRFNTKYKDDKVFKWYLEKAQNGHSYAQFMVGDIGRLNNDNEFAEKWLLKSARQGDVYAQYQLANLYLKMKADAKTDTIPPETIEWLTEAARQSDMFAQYELARIYEVKGEKPDALKWYRKAQKAGHTYAAEKIRKLESKR